MTSVSLYLGDCLEVMAGLDLSQVTAVVTDPPYPDYHTDKWAVTPIEFLRSLPCRQLVFWSNKADFPLDFSAVHIWRKVGVGCASMYERIFERNGACDYRVYNANAITNHVTAQMAKDVWWGHPSQKPVSLMVSLVQRASKRGGTVIDPFMGSGSTGMACLRTGRHFIGIECNPRYFAVAQRRLMLAQDSITLASRVVGDDGERGSEAG